MDREQAGVSGSGSWCKLACGEILHVVLKRFVATNVVEACD